jgi:hypothetical protein
MYVIMFGSFWKWDATGDTNSETQFYPGLQKNKSDRKYL